MKKTQTKQLSPEEKIETKYNRLRNILFGGTLSLMIVGGATGIYFASKDNPEYARLKKLPQVQEMIYSEMQLKRLYEERKFLEQNLQLSSGFKSSILEMIFRDINIHSETLEKNESVLSDYKQELAKEKQKENLGLFSTLLYEAGLLAGVVGLDKKLKRKKERKFINLYKKK